MWVQSQEDFPLPSRLWLVGAIGLLWGCHELSLLTAAASCFFAGAWLHSFMDIFDGPWADDEGVYEHFRNRWIRALNFVPYASGPEWILLLISVVLVIVISLRLPPLAWFPRWGVATIYLVIVVGTLVYEYRTVVPKRLETEGRIRKPDTPG